MIRVCYSNRIERLVGALAGALPPVGDIDAVFGGPWLVVPNRPLEMYVDLELARRRGVSGNIDTMSLPGAFARLCAEATPDVVLIERGHLTGELLAALGDPVLEGGAALAALHGYVRAAGTAPDALDRRRVDLAQSLGALFDDWILTRPEVCASWSGAPVSERDTGTSDGATDHHLRRAERALWRALFGPDGRFARRGAAEKKRYLTLPDLLAQRLDDAWRPPPATHVFGLSRIPRGHQMALDRLGARTQVILYAVNPCREFWEDLNTGRRPRANIAEPATKPAKTPRRGRAHQTEEGSVRQLEFAALARPVPDDGRAQASAVAGGDGPHDDNPLLALWGHAGRETTRVMNDLSNGDFADQFMDPIANGPGAADRRPTLLTALQRNLLDRTALDSGAGGVASAADDSIVFLGAPNPRREWETIAAEIWALVRADADAATDGAPAPTATGTPLRFSDIAVLIAGPDEPYLSLARAVFREANDLPHTIADQPLGATSPLIEAVLDLLGLPLGKLTRREVLDVITHPNVRARFPEADPQVWLDLCDALTISHGADRADFANTYVDADRFNWDQGFKRLALGVFARGPRSGIEDPITLPGGAAEAPGGDYAPAEIAPDLRPDADALALLVRSLLADARFAQTARMPLGGWTRFVRALCAAYVVPTTAQDEAARLRVFATLDQLSAQSPPDVPVALGVAHQMIRASLANLRAGRGQILGAGVTVGNLSALRGLPFRVIFVAGLGPERFPTADHTSPLDLDADQRGTRDVTPRQEDRYLMIETLLAARDKLVLSYLDRDALTGDAREPSSVVLEFLDQLGRVLPGPPVVRRIPLHRDQDPRARAAFPGAAAEAQARVIGEQLRGDIAPAARLAPTAIVRGFSDDTLTALQPLLRTTKAPAPMDALASASATRTGPRVLHLADLRRFLECPLQGSARVFLGLRDLPDDTEAREIADEPFDVPRLLERSLLGDVFATAWSSSGIPTLSELAVCYDAAVSRQRAAHAFPAGLFRDSVRDRHLDVFAQWSAALADGDHAPRGPLRRTCFGRPQPFAPPADRRDAIRLVVDVPGQGPRAIEIHGTTEPQVALGDLSGSLVLATSYDPGKNDKDGLRSFVDYVALAASAPDGEPPAGFRGALCRPSKKGAPLLRAHSFAPLDRNTARTYLGQLAAELLSGVHAYLLPCEAIFFVDRNDLTRTERIKQIQSDSYLRERSSSWWGPVPEPFGYPVPESAEADRMATQRFGLLFDRRITPPPRERKGRS